MNPVPEKVGESASAQGTPFYCLFKAITSLNIQTLIFNNYSVYTKYKIIFRKMHENFVK